MFSTWKEWKETVKKLKNVTDNPPYFERNTQTNLMSVRGERFATRFIVRNLEDIAEADKQLIGTSDSLHH